MHERLRFVCLSSRKQTTHSQWHLWALLWPALLTFTCARIAFANANWVRWKTYGENGVRRIPPHKFHLEVPTPKWCDDNGKCARHSRRISPAPPSTPSVICNCDRLWKETSLDNCTIHFVEIVFHRIHALVILIRAMILYFCCSQRAQNQCNGN